jgi:hypothetical protein
LKDEKKCAAGRTMRAVSSCESFFLRKVARKMNEKMNVDR